MPYILLVLAALFWSGNFVVSRGMHADIPPIALSFWRWALALLILSTFALRHFWAERAVVRRHSRFILIQGIFGVAGFNTLIYLAIQSTTAINAVLVNSCIPVLIGVVSWVLYREVMSLRQCCGVVLSLVGVFLIIAQGQLNHLLQVQFNRGDLLVLLAALVWAVYSANLKRYPKELHPFAFQTGIVIVGLFCIFPFYLYELMTRGGFALTANVAATILYVALFASVLAFIFWNRAVRTVGANKAGPFIHLMPVFSTILAVLFLAEKLYSYHYQGIFLIFTGIMMTTFRVVRKAS